MEKKYPIGIEPQEVWDEFSEYVDDDSDSFSLYAGRSVMLYDSFVRALSKMQPAPAGAVWVTGQYDRLYDRLKAEPEKPFICWKNHNYYVSDRGICSIKGNRMEFVSHDTVYGSIAFITGNEKENFISLCKIFNIEWLDESGAPEPPKQITNVP